VSLSKNKIHDKSIKTIKRHHPNNRLSEIKCSNGQNDEWKEHGQIPAIIGACEICKYNKEGSDKGKINIQGTLHNSFLHKEDTREKAASP
jgi:hypothetical protein